MTANRPTSSTEAEYMAAALCVRHIIWLHQLLLEIGANPDNLPTMLYLDNKGAIDLTKDSCHHQQTKHIDVSHHFIRERVEDGSLNIVYIPTSQMLADGFTKPLSRVPFEQMVSGLNHSIISEQGGVLA